MQKFLCLLLSLKRSYICYYVICMTVALKLYAQKTNFQTMKILFTFKYFHISWFIENEVLYLILFSKKTVSKLQN